MPENQRPYGKWSREELLEAEAAASQFLEQNCLPIADAMRAKAKFLADLIHRLSLETTSFDDRLEYLARVGEIAQLIQEDADGFFALASQPGVALILKAVQAK